MRNGFRNASLSARFAVFFVSAVPFPGPLSQAYTHTESLRSHAFPVSYRSVCK